MQCTLIKAVGFEELPGTEALKDCDVALFYTRRLRIDGEALQNVKDYCLSGKPIVAIRTASHGFQNWLEFDRSYWVGTTAGIMAMILLRAENPARSRRSSGTRRRFRTHPLALQPVSDLTRGG